MFRSRFLILGLAVLGAAAPTDPRGDYKLMQKAPLGGPERWDYASFDPTSHRVFVAHSTEATVVDSRTGTVVGRIEGLDGAHGIVVVPDLKHGYANSGRRSTMTEFDLESLKPLKEVEIGADSDAIIYDPASKRVFAMLGETGKVAVLDTVTDALVTNVDVGGKLEFPAVDGQGKLFINNEERREIVRFDTKDAKIDARWPIADCDSPHGLAIDVATRRLFSTCVNQLLVVVDADDGHVVQTVPIGRGTDAAAFDPKRKLVFSSNGEGTLSIIAEQGKDDFVPLGDLPTAPGARTMTLDPEAGRIFLVTAEIDKIEPPKAPGERPRTVYKPGSAELLILDPVS
jgi:DNA-binding beta-propeller fold protein YncE